MSSTRGEVVSSRGSGALLTMALLTMALLTMALLTMALLTMATSASELEPSSMSTTSTGGAASSGKRDGRPCVGTSVATRLQPYVAEAATVCMWRRLTPHLSGAATPNNIGCGAPLRAARGDN